MQGIELIRIAASLNMLLFGIDQILRPQLWLHYVPNVILKNLPTSLTTTLRIHSLGNLSLGVLFLLNVFPNVVSILTLIWWLGILPFAILKDWRVAVRNSVIIVAILVYILNQ